MEYRKIPGTDLNVSTITLGTMTYGSPVPFEDAVRLTEYAVSQGINIIDTANMYEGYNRTPGSSGGVAEEIIGAFLKKYDRNKVVIATKLGMKVGDAPEDEGTSAAAMDTHLELSMRRMQTDYVDIYYLHKPDPDSSLEDTLTTMNRKIKEGKVRYYGVSNYNAAQLSELIQTADRLDVARPVICEPPLSLLKQEALEELLPLCAKENIAVTPYQIFQGGLLTGKYHRGAQAPEGSRGSEMPGWLWKLEDGLYDQLEAIEAEAAKEGCTMLEYAIRWTLRQPAVVSAIVGVKKTSQIDAAVKA